MSANRRDFLKTAALTGVAGLGGFTPADMQATSMYNGVYTAVCNNAKQYLHDKSRWK